MVAIDRDSFVRGADAPVGDLSEAVRRYYMLARFSADPKAPKGRRFPTRPGIVRMPIPKENRS